MPVPNPKSVKFCLTLLSLTINKEKKKTNYIWCFPSKKHLQKTFQIFSVTFPFFAVNYVSYYSLIRMRSKVVYEI